MHAIHDVRVHLIALRNLFGKNARILFPQEVLFEKYQRKPVRSGVFIQIVT